MDLSQLLSLTAVLAHIATFPGMPPGILLLVVDRRRSREYREPESYRSVFKKRQWTGWQASMRDWASREDCQIAWRDSFSEQFDSEFVSLMNELIAQTAGTKH